MIKEVMATALTIDEAIEKAANELGVSKEDCKIEIIETPKKSLFGKHREAVIKASIEIKEVVLETKLDVAKKYLRDILDAMNLSTVELNVVEKEDGATITFEGDDIAVLIGHHGETLDAIQYLVSLTSNRTDGDYYRISLDCGNYREKREETLKGLATRIAEKVKKTGRSQLLEPMNPYERRIIHSIVSEIDGVFSKSKGEEPNRRVVILSESPSFSKKTNNRFNKNDNNNSSNNNSASNFKKKPYVHVPELTMEQILKGEMKEKADKAELYSKFEF